MNRVVICDHVLDHPGWDDLNEATGYRIDELMGLWCLMVRHAAQHNEHGYLTDWNDEDPADELGMTWREVEFLREAMQGIFLDGLHLTGRDVMWRVG